MLTLVNGVLVNEINLERDFLTDCSYAQVCVTVTIVVVMEFSVYKVIHVVTVEYLFVPASWMVEVAAELFTDQFFCFIFQGILFFKL